MALKAVANNLASPPLHVLDFVYDWGADNTGATDVTAKLIAAIQHGGSLHVPPGTYLIAAAGPSAGGAWCTITKSMAVTCDPLAIFVAGFGLDHDMIRISVPAGGVGLPAGKIRFEWEGGQFDQSVQKNSTSMPYTNIYPGGSPAGVGTSATDDALSVRGAYTVAGTVYGAFDMVRVIGVSFTSGAHWQIAGGDQQVYVGEGADMVEVDCWHQGARDLAVYVSRDGTGAVGNNAVVRGTYINCFYGQGFKRGLRECSSEGRYINCVGGVTINHIIGGLTSSVRVSGTFDGCLQAVRMDFAVGVDVSRCVVTNMGALLADGTTPIDPFLGNPLGVTMKGATYCRAHDNLFDGFNPAYAKALCSGVVMEEFTDGVVGTLPSTYNDVINNIANNLHTIGSETAGQANYNRWIGNRLLSCDLAGVALSGANSSEIRYNETYSNSEFMTGLMSGDGTTTKAALARRGDPTTGINFATNAVIVQVAGANALNVTFTAMQSLKPITTPVGTAGTPAYGYTAEAGLGFFRAATGKVGFSVGGVQSVEFNSIGMALTASYTVATLPNAATFPRAMIYVSDGTTNKHLAISDGTNWRWPDGAVVS